MQLKKEISTVGFYYWATRALKDFFHPAASPLLALERSRDSGIHLEDYGTSTIE